MGRVRQSHPSLGRGSNRRTIVWAAGLWLTQFVVVTGFSLAGRYPHPLEAGLRRLAMAVVGILLFWMIGAALGRATSRPARARLMLAILLLVAGSLAWSLSVFAIAHAPIGGRDEIAARIGTLRELALNAFAVAGLFAAWICLLMAIGYRRALREAEPKRIEADEDMTASGELWVPTRLGKTRLPLEGVEYFEADHDYVRVHARSGRYLVHRTLQALHDDVASRRFLRVHRSFVVNLTAVAELRRRGRDLLELALASGARIPVGRTYSAEVRERLGLVPVSS
jgi:hypothetical protein